MPIRTRSWIFVINNYTMDDVACIMSACQDEFGPKGVFMVYGFEVGELGTPHIQGYVYFKDAKTRKAVSALIPRAHLECAQGTPEDNIRYIVGPYNDPKTGKKKGVNDDVVVYGKKPHQGRASFGKVEEAMQDPKNHIHVYTQYRKAYKEIKVDEPVDQRPRIPKGVYSADKFKVARTHRDCKICFYDGSNYNGEDVVFVPMSCCADLPPKWQKIESRYYDMIDQWRNGFPPVIKNGYEMIRFDPTFIYVICDSRDNFKQKFSI